MDDAKPVGRPAADDGLTKGDRVRRCLGVMGTSGTGKTWYVVRDRSIDRSINSKKAIVTVALGTRRSAQEKYPAHSIALLSGYPARMRRWIISKFEIPMKD